MTCIQVSTYIWQSTKIIPKEWHPVLPSYKLLETLDFLFFAKPTKPSSQRCHFQEFRYAATLVRGWSLKKVWFKKNTIFLDQNLGSSSCFHSVFIETSFLLRSQFQIQLFHLYPQGERMGRLSRQSCKSWKNQICKIQPDDWKRRWHIHPGLGYSSYFCFFWDDIKRQDPFPKINLVSWFLCWGKFLVTRCSNWLIHSILDSLFQCISDNLTYIIYIHRHIC